MEILIGEYENKGDKKFFTEPQYVTIYRNKISYRHYREGQYNKYPLLLPHYQYIMQEEYRILRILMFSKFIKVFHNILDFLVEDKYGNYDWIYVYKMLKKNQVVNKRLLDRKLLDDKYINLILHYYRLNYEFIINLLKDDEVKEKMKEVGIDGIEQGMFLDFLLMMNKNCKGENFDDDVNKLFNKIASEYDINKIEQAKIEVIGNGK